LPELPDIEAYLSALDARVRGARLEGVTIATPFLLRTLEPRPAECVGRRVVELRRVGKRVAIGLEDELWLVLHLMIAGRLHWQKKGKALASFAFSTGVLSLTEAGSKRRASLHVARGEAGLAALDPGGLEPLACTFEEFRVRLTEENHTLKRALTDPRAFSGIGNAYSDEILHAAGLSPVLQTGRMTAAQVETLFAAVRGVLESWRERLRGEGFPEKVTAFRPEMAVHGKFGQPCPKCGAVVQRIRYADNETNYCPVCQTEGRLLADRGLSRLLGKDWPRTLDELETLKRR
jgi:formamidopyrimidine-DNA glycosylase